LVDQYRIGPGDLESHVERTAWLLGAADALSDTLDAGVSVFGAVREELPSADAEADRRRP
jgi:helicase